MRYIKDRKIVISAYLLLPWVLLLFGIVIYVQFKTIEGPAVQFEETFYDGGIRTKYDNRFVRHTFKFKNTGDEIFKVLDVKTDCGCNVVEDMQKEFLPGEEGVLEANLGLGIMGRKSSVILVTSNAPDSPHAITMQGTYLPETFVSYMPEVINFGELSLGDTDEKRLRVTVFHDKLETISVPQIDCINNKMDISIQNITRLKQRTSLGYYQTLFDIAVAPKTSKEVKELNDQLIIHIDSLAVDDLEIPVEGEYLSEWVCRPQGVMYYVSGETSDLPQRKLRVENSLGKTISCINISNPFSEWIDVDVEKSKYNNELNVLIKPKFIPSQKKLNGFITLHLSSDESVIFKIPVSFTNYTNY